MTSLLCYVPNGKTILNKYFYSLRLPFTIRPMKRYRPPKTSRIILLVCISLFFASILNAQEFSFIHNGITRTYILYIPTTYNGSKPYPLIFALHGASGTGSTFLKNGFNERAELLEYIAVYPDGVNNVWNVGYGGADDVGFLSALIDTLKARYTIDSKRVYFTGHSNGSFMCYTLAAEIPEKIAAIAPVEGLLISGLINRISVPIPVIHIHALDDTAVPYQGSSYEPGVDSLMNIWKRNNRCTDIPETLYNSNDVIGQKWVATETGADVVLYKFKSGGHTWLNAPLYITDLIVDFFQTHPKREKNVRMTSSLAFQYDVHASIELSATVESSDPATKVEYFANSTKIGESSLSPYSCTWSDVQGNDYIVYAKALYADGKSTISSNPQLIHVLLPNAALHKPGECSSMRSSSFPADNAFDDDFTTRWTSNYSDPQWISVDLQGMYRISGVTLYWGPTYAPSYSVDVSDDKNNWTTVYSTTAGNGNAEFISFIPVEARYVRMVGTTRSTPWGYSVYEFGVQGEFVKAMSISNSTVEKFQLNMSVAPNPFNPSTTIRFDLPQEMRVTLDIYNMSGTRIRTLMNNQSVNAGRHTIIWDSNGENGVNISSGVYICRMRAGNFQVSRKLVLLK
jgi:polyhydroxybutyrate depolymerase